jgi:hypothetical protein
LRPETGKCVAVVVQVAQRGDIEVYAVEGPPTYLVPPTFAEVISWPEFQGVPTYDELVMKRR